MARPLKPLVRGGGYYPSRKWTPLVYPGGYTTANGGEQPEPEAVLKTVTGSLIHITDALALPAKALSTNISPIQDLHGYDSPWPAGGGKNKFNVDAIPGSSVLTITNGNIVITSANNNTGKTLGELANVAVGETYILTATSTAAANYIYLAKSANSWYYGTSRTLTQDDLDSRVVVYGASGETTTISDMMIRLSSVAGPTFAPYSNICPISGRTSATIYHSGADTSDPTTYTIQLGDTVYGGKLDVTGGKMVVDRVFASKLWSELTSPTVFTNTTRKLFIKPAEYRGNNERKTLSNIGQDIGGTSEDFVHVNTYTNGTNIYVFMPNDTPDSTVIELCYIVGTPIEITLTPTQIEMLLGENNLWADAGDSTLTYYADGNASTSEALGILLGGTYNNPGGADDVSDDEALGILLGGS